MSELQVSSNRRLFKKLLIVGVLILLPLMSSFQNCADSSAFMRGPLVAMPRTCTVSNASLQTLSQISAFKTIPESINYKYVLKPGQTEETILPQGTILSIKREPLCGEPFITSLVLEKDTTVNQLNQELELDACIEAAELPERARLSALPAHMNFVKATNGWNTFYTSSNPIGAVDVVIAIIDGGVKTHTNLSFWTNPGETAGNGVDDDGNGKIDDVNGWNFYNNNNRVDPVLLSNPEAAHGTHVAGLAAASVNDSLNIAGSMKLKAKVMSLNIFGDYDESKDCDLVPKPNPCNRGVTDLDVAHAIDYAISKRAHVINLSLAVSGFSATMLDAVARAAAQGIIVVSAAGNDGIQIGTSRSDSNYISPASFTVELPNEVFTVGSLEIKTDGTYANMSFFTNFHPVYVNISAPGSEDGQAGILSTGLANNTKRLQGTSMSSPIVAGAAGLAAGLARTRGYVPHISLTEAIVNWMQNSGQTVAMVDDPATAGINEANFRTLNNKALDLEAFALLTNQNLVTPPNPALQTGTGTLPTICP
ncbi:MAG: S8 family serine peptidase [Oligoflexia bacterium]|nr:S8 family serine peptidase [Oligoflexia bacterium]